MKKTLITNWISKIALLSACSVALSSFAHSQTDLDFSFISHNSSGGTGNFTDSTTGVPFSLTVTSSNRPFVNFNGSSGTTPTAIYIGGASAASRVTLSFSRDISDFTLNVFDLDLNRPTERLENFSIIPDSVSSNFNLDTINNRVRPLNNNFDGTVSWVNLPPGTRDISFDLISGDAGRYIGLSGSIPTPLAVPEPTTTAFLGLGGLAFLARRKRA